MKRVFDSLPPHVFFLVSALFHYLGPSFAVLLFAQLSPEGVAWLRVASAALIFALWAPPWRILASEPPSARRLILVLGIILASMNICFYLAIARLPLATVAAIEFAATIAVALFGLRTPRNLAALCLAVSGVCLLIGFEWSNDLPGLGFAFANAILFALYVIAGHAVAREGGRAGIGRLGAAMVIAFIAVSPFGFGDIVVLASQPILILAGVGVGISSSVIPYVCDQLAMARLPRASFALMLSLLPAIAAAMGALVLGQIPDIRDLSGIALVIVGVGLHRPADLRSNALGEAVREAR